MMGFFKLRFNAAVSILLFFLGTITVAGQKIRHAEMLGRPTDKSVTLRLMFEEVAEIQVEYGTTAGSLNHKTTWTVFTAGQLAEILIKELEPDTRYFYRVLHRSPGESGITFRPEYNFHTQRKPGSEYTFVIQADPHLDEQSDTALYSRCLSNQLADQPDFVIDLGDIIMTDKLKNASGKITRDTITKRCQYMRTFYEKLCHSVPLLMALGNHEGEAGWTLNGNSENTAIWGTLERKKYFANPAPDDFYTGDDTDHLFVGKRENYYSWSWGDVLFVVLDPYWYTTPKPDANTGWRWTLGKKQYDWLKNTLEFNESRFKFVICHQLVGGDPNGRGGIEYADLYEWGGNNKDGSFGFVSNRPGWYKPIKDLLTENRVNVFFHGHDHFFGKQEKECLIYQECPQPSHPNYQNANQAEDYGYLKGQILPNSGHLRIHVKPEEVKIEYVRAYLPSVENANRKNRDVAATYFLHPVNCYDSLSTGLPVIWNSEYVNELIYPNPFETETNITFSVQQKQYISLQINDKQGRIIKHLIKESEMSAGQYSVIWDGTNETVQEMNSGVYYYLITNNSGRIASGQILLK